MTNNSETLNYMYTHLGLGMVATLHFTGKGRAPLFVLIATCTCTCTKDVVSVELFTSL